MWRDYAKKPHSQHDMSRSVSRVSNINSAFAASLHKYLRRNSGDDVVDNVAVDIGQAEVASGVAICQFGVIEAE